MHCNQQKAAEKQKGKTRVLEIRKPNKTERRKKENPRTRLIYRAFRSSKPTRYLRCPCIQVRIP